MNRTLLVFATLFLSTFFARPTLAKTHRENIIQSCQKSGGYVSGSIRFKKTTECAAAFEEAMHKKWAPLLRNDCSASDHGDKHIWLLCRREIPAQILEPFLQEKAGVNYSEELQRGCTTLRSSHSPMKYHFRSTKKCHAALVKAQDGNWQPLVKNMCDTYYGTNGLYVACAHMDAPRELKKLFGDSGRKKEKRQAAAPRKSMWDWLRNHVSPTGGCIRDATGQESCSVGIQFRGTF